MEQNLKRRRICDRGQKIKIVDGQEINIRLGTSQKNIRAGKGFGAGINILKSTQIIMTYIIQRFPHFFYTFATTFLSCESLSILAFKH